LKFVAIVHNVVYTLFFLQNFYHGRDVGGSYRLPPVREESLGAADARARNLPRNINNNRSSSSRVAHPGPESMMSSNGPTMNGDHEQDSDGDDMMELPPPPESIMDLAEPLSSRKVPPKPPPKPNRFSQGQLQPARDPSGSLQDEGDDGTEI
jgi:hypothetical protein